MALTLNFKQLGKNDAPIAGGKGASLGEMTKAGIPVPPGFVVLSATFDEFILDADLTQEIHAILDNVSHKDINSVEQASEKIQALIKDAEMPPRIAKEIKKQFKELNTEFVAVRSSATAEDGAENAWAGQLDSYLNTKEKNLLEKVQHCWASLFTPRAIFYRFEKGLHNTKISVAVVVQKMVNSEVSGIAFSVHPVTEDRNQLIIEAGFGLGEAIVSGQVTPDSYVVEKEPRRIIDTNVSTQTRGLYRVKSGGNEWIDIREPRASSQVLTEAQILEFANIIMRIENHYGFPCDIEWAFEKGKFYVVQSRPITTLADKTGDKKMPSGTEKKKEEKPKGEEWFLFEDFGDCSPVVGADYVNIKRINDFHKSVGIKSKLKASISEYKDGHIYFYFIKKEFDDLSREIVNKVSKNPKFFIKFNDEVVQRSDELSSESRKILSKNLPKLSDKELFDLFMKAFSGYEHAHISGWIQNAADFGEGLLSKYLIEYIKKQIEKKKGKKYSVNEVFVKLTTPLEDSNAQKEYLDLLGIIEYIQKNNKLLKLFNNTESKKIESTLCKLDKALDDKINKHAEDFGYLGHGLVGPSWGRFYFIDIISSLIRQNTNSRILKSKFSEEKEKTKKEQKALVKELAIDNNHQEVFEAVKGFVFTKGYRKDSMFYYWHVLDTLLGEIGKRMKLNITQIKFIHPSEFKKSILDRKYSAKVLDERFKRSLYYSEGAYNEETILTGDEVDKFKNKFSFVKEASTDVTELSGTCASPGRARGECRVVNTIKDIEKMKKGDVLISIVTSPELVPAMKIASAIITDTGGITCHAAIVSRELGIPCVIGTKIATKVLTDGTLVDVDATHGRIVIIEKAGKKKRKK